MARATDPVALAPCHFPRILMGKLRFPEAPRPCSAPGDAWNCSPCSGVWNPRGAGPGYGEERGQGVCAGVRSARAAAASPAPRLRARACGREGAANSRARRSSPFFPADPGKGGRFGGGTAEGGIPSLVRAEGWPLSRLGAAAGEARRGERELGRGAGSGPPRGARGERAAQRTDAPGGAPAPEGVSRSRIEQLGTRRAERARARDSRAAAAAAAGERRALAPPGSAAAGLAAPR